MKPSPPRQYWICEVQIRCSACRHEFTAQVAGGDEVLRLATADGRRVRWIPLLGPGGYLDLLKRLVPEYDEGTEIAMRVARLFDERFAALQTTGDGVFHFEGWPRHCPRCGKQDLSSVSEEKVIPNCPVEWIEYAPLPGEEL